MDIKDSEIDGLLTELRAGKILGGRPTDKAFNDGVDRAVRAIIAYRNGIGLFQERPAKEPA